MKKTHHSQIVDFTVLTVMVFYFLVATTHIFFLSHKRDQLQNKQVTGNSIFKRRMEITSGSASQPTQIKRPDKSTFEEKNNVSDIIIMAARFFVLLLFISLTSPLNSRFSLLKKDITTLPRHTFLSLQIIRI
ncbi:hypothetical protein DYU05_00490 [Mucilaginibacter terrenus]|uniref:Uncharacterized protein n=1 Tax=Mucilaginibacter terrenus TaxID=2482727 RepID=A0A3E2NT55_9SPHI|nr:hypothetical protein [Mucilaginibacter terrenus]RFZ84149.1 hypothetical protein DYU05_00490 [Mucilaginibacter terrenus]